MEPRILYEASFELNSSLVMMMCTPVAVLIALLCIRRKARKTGKTGLKVATWVLVGVLSMSVLFTALLGAYDAKMYSATVGAYQRGEYQTVEGYVEDFHPMPASGHDLESFTIDGVRFEYSDYNIQFGYHNARSLGGVITGDGQHLKIGYTEFFGQGLIIVYIEELPG